MDFSPLTTHRYSVRGYTAQPVEPEKLQKVLEAARMAPSACNFQPFKLYVIPTAGRQEALNRIYKPDWFVQAPYVICICTLEDQAWIRRSDNQSYAMVDAAIAFDHLILAATELGLGTCWVGAFKPQEARQVLQLPDTETPVLFTPLGYANTTIPPKKRKNLEELVTFLPDA